MSNLSVTEQLSRMERRLAEGTKRLTLTEAAAATGLSVDEAEATLRELLTRYDCILQVTEYGDIIYDFGPQLHRRNEKSFREYLGEFLELLWKGFVIFFKAWIAITLVVYFLIFLTLLVMAVIALLFSGDNKNGRRRSSSADSMRLIFWAARFFTAIFDWATATPVKTYRTDRHGYRYAAYQPKPSLLQTQDAATPDQSPPKKSFIASVYDFVFGPPRVTRDPLENQKEIAAYVRRHQGILFVSEVKALTGLDSTPAALLFSDCIGRFQGDIRISERQLMYGQFDRLLRTAGQQDEGQIVYYWDEYEPPHLLTGNTTAMNLLIMFLNGFNLFFSLIILAGDFDGSGLSRFWLGVVPGLFSTIFFAVPLLRLPWVLLREARREAENQRRRVMQAIFLNRGRALTPEQVLHFVNRPGGPEPLSKRTVEDILARLVRDLPGEIRTDAQGQVLYEFPVIALELEEAERLRAQRTVDRDLGKVIFDSRQ
ncbi:MAG: hypothetical protein ACUVR8_12895 [Acidobacteriota bacterium]